MKKKIAFLLSAVLVLSLSLLGINANDKAYAKTAEVSFSIPDSVKKETEFKLTLQLNSDVDLYSINAYLSYDPDMLEFVPDDARVTGTEGVLELKDSYGEKTRNASYEITFRPLQTGKTEVELKDVYLIDYADMDYIEVASSAKSFNIGVNKNEESDARLNDLIVAPGDLTEPFLPGKMEYEMHVGLDVEMIGLSAIPMEEDSVVDLDMPEKLQIGENEIRITVTALSGNVKTYILKVYKEELNDISKDVQNVEDIHQEFDEITTQEVTEQNTETSEQITESTEESSDEEIQKEEGTGVAHTSAAE